MQINQEYDNKNRECWEEFMTRPNENPQSLRRCFDFAFDRAYAFGKQTETITQEKIEVAAKEYAAEVDKNVRDLYGIEEQPASLTFGECAAESFREGVNFALGKQAKDAEDTVIQGWVAKDNDIDGVYLYSSMPERGINMWNGHGSLLTHLASDLFPDLTWDDNPIEVEIIIKRKKNG